MQVFISVAESGGFSESARRLGLSQPSVSRQINALEEYLGVRLLQRTTRQLNLTEAGEIYYEKARQIQRDVIEAKHSIAGFKDTPSGTLKIAAPFTWADVIIAPYMNEFLALYPELKLNIECNDKFQDVIEDQLDLVIRVGVLQDSSNIAVPLTKVRLVMIATPDYIVQHGSPQTTADLQNHNCILFEDYDQVIFNNAKQTQQISISGSISTNSVTVMLSSVLQHLGITFLPDVLINDLLQKGDLVALMPSHSISFKNLPIDQVFVLYPNRKHLPAKARVFIEFYREKFRQQRGKNILG